MYMLSALLVSSAALTGRTLRAPQRAARLTPRCDLAGDVGALQDRVEMLQALVTKQEQIIGTLLHEQYGQGEKQRDPSSAPGGPSAASDDSPGDAPAGQRWHRVSLRMREFSKRSEPHRLMCCLKSTMRCERRRNEPLQPTTWLG